ncbi:arginyl-tRNA synthetase [Actinobacillus equuli]|nr:arginyl-tRNA synthetase [Actinobacillus equuli]
MLTFEGNTAPYMQYAYTRIRSIFNRAGIDVNGLNGEINLTEDKERALAVKLLQFEEALNGVAKDGMPHILCQYLYELAGTFSSFYEACPMLNAEENVKIAV